MKITNNNIVYVEGSLWQTRNNGRNYIQEVKNCLLDINMQFQYGGFYINSEVPFAVSSQNY
jgi:hypothetical protein